MNLHWIVNQLKRKPKPDIEEVIKSSERIVKASEELAKRTDTLGKMVRNMKGTPKKSSKRGKK